jgi:hypothetical protein
MNVATKALISMMIVTMMTIGVPQASAVSTRQAAPRDARQLQRRLKKLDRHYELRASILGMSSDQLRQKLRTQPLTTIARQAGFRSEASFYTALVGKAKDELSRRGMNDRTVQRFLAKHVSRSDKSPVV